MAKYGINYSKVIGQANDIKDLSNDLNGEINKLEKHLATVANEWKGPASDEYQKQLKNLIKRMKSTKTQMSNLATTIKTVAKSIQEQDKALAEKAKKDALLGGDGGGFR